MIFYRLTDKQGRRATAAILVGLPVIAFMALKLVDERRENMAIGFVCIMVVLFGLIAVQISQSRRLDRHEREVAHG